jgi:hypothetical protein
MKLAHVEAMELDPERGRQLLRDLGLSDAGRTGEQERADGLVGRARPARCSRMADTTVSIAASWPNTSSLMSRSSV